MELRRLRQLEEENAQLKRIVADLTLDKQMLQDVLKKALKVRQRRRSGLKRSEIAKRVGAKTTKEIEAYEKDEDDLLVSCVVGLCRPGLSSRVIFSPTSWKFIQMRTLLFRSFLGSSKSGRPNRQRYRRTWNHLRPLL